MHMVIVIGLIWKEFHMSCITLPIHFGPFPLSKTPFVSQIHNSQLSQNRSSRRRSTNPPSLPGSLIATHYLDLAIVITISSKIALFSFEFDHFQEIQSYLVFELNLGSSETNQKSDLTQSFQLLLFVVIVIISMLLFSVSEFVGVCIVFCVVDFDLGEFERQVDLGCVEFR